MSYSGREGGKNGKAPGTIHAFNLPNSCRAYRLTGISTNTHILFNEFNTSLKILIAQHVKNISVYVCRESYFYVWIYLVVHMDLFSVKFEEK